MEASKRVLPGKKRYFPLLSIALVVVLIMCAFTGADSRGASETPEAQQVLYRESTVTRGDITVGVTENAVAALKTYSLSFEIEGSIEQIAVKPGQQVKDGDFLASVDTSDAQEELRALQSDYRSAALSLSDAQLSRQKGEISAKNSYETTMNKADAAEATYSMNIEKLNRAIKQAENEIEEIYKEISTYRVLLYYGYFGDDYDEDEDGDDYMSRSDYYSKYDKSFKTEREVKVARDEAYVKLENAEAALKEAKYNLEVQSAEAQFTKEQALSSAELAQTSYNLELQSLANSVVARQLALERIQEDINTLTEKLEKNRIVSPCDGIVTAVNYSEGNSVQAGAAVLTVSDSNRVFTYISVTQDDITGISLDQACAVSMDAFETILFDGVVDTITTTPARSASGSASYNVVIRLLGDTAQIYEGMTGSATLITRQRKDVLYVTYRSVYEKDGQSYVKVKADDGTITETPVTTGFSDGRNVEITKGLKEGQTVLIESQVNAQA